MSEIVKSSYIEDVHIAEILADSEIAHREYAIRLRKLGRQIITVTKYRDIQLEKAKWHDKRANQDSSETLKALEEGDLQRVNELADPNRKPYKPKRHELPEEARTPET
jgi:galactokinase